MALALSRYLRRAIPLSLSLLRPLPPTIPARSPPIRSPNSLLQALGFKSSSQLFNYRSDISSQENKISPDEILFEGCDYNHWLITMDFPDPKPTPEEMVETYVQTCAKVLGSVEEAKKKIYACSTTTYNGFQVEMSEEMSEKFRGLPGVVFILPDSYLYPETKEYGGDKYDNGVITPRPPPIQFGQRRPRNKVRFEQQPPYSNPQAQQQQGSFQTNPPQQQTGSFLNSSQQHGHQPGDPQNYSHHQGQQPGHFQNYPQQQRPQPGNFQNYPQQQGPQSGNFQNYPQQQRPQPGNFQNYPQQQRPQPGNFQNYPQQQRPQPGNFQNYPQQQRPQPGYIQNFQGPRESHGPPQGVRDGGYQRDFNPGQRGEFGPREQRKFSQEPLPGYDMRPTGDAHGEPTQGYQDAWKERQ